MWDSLEEFLEINSRFIKSIKLLRFDSLASC